MLVLGRKIGEQIVIGDSIVVTLLDIKRHVAKFGIDAPREMPVLRKELWTKPIEEKK